MKRFEEKIFEIEKVRLIIRAGEDHSVGKFDFSRKYKGSNTIDAWLNARVRSPLDGFDFVIVDGRGYSPGNNMTMDNLRNSYYS